MHGKKGKVKCNVTKVKKERKKYDKAVLIFFLNFFLIIWNISAKDKNVFNPKRKYLQFRDGDVGIFFYVKE